MKLGELDEIGLTELVPFVQYVGDLVIRFVGARREKTAALVIGARAGAAGSGVVGGRQRWSIG
ncbi:MAG: hypothetical protein ACRDRX_20390 [Pseudonocardiaceae bacterium]